MREIKYIKDVADWNKTIEANKYLLANFTASWCGPCKFIKPFVDQLYQKDEYKKIEFVRIDTDTVPDVCTQFGISGIPSFVLLKLGKEIDRVTGDFQADLPLALSKLAQKAAGDASVEQRASSVQSAVFKDVQKFIPNGFELLNNIIHFGDSVALNIMALQKNNDDIKNVLRENPKGDATVYTDADSQGLFFVQLNNISKVHSILLKLSKPQAGENTNLDAEELEDECQHPSVVKVWANKPSILSFDDAAGDTNAQNVTKIEAADLPGWYEVKLKYVRFQSVQTLNIFVDGEDEDNHTVIEQILLVGVGGDSAKSQPINTDD